MTDLLAKFFSHSAINEAMQDSWNDICSDTGCHPLDIKHGKGKVLTFSPNHWANQIAKLLFVRAVKFQLESDAAQSWRPIETSPRDGTHISIVNAYNPNIPPTTAHWFDGGWHLSVNQMGEYSEYVWGPPTHWMPLLVPPADRG